jgi:NitT/TauT family transport system substrate-binding protein
MGGLVKMNKLKIMVMLLLCAMLSATFGAINVQAADKVVKIKMAQPGQDNYGIAIYIADKLGYFADEGLELEFVNFKSSPLSIAAMLAGEVQFTLTSYDQALKMYEKGRILKNLITTTEKHPWAILARPEIKTVTELKGKTISAKMPGSGPRAFVSTILIRSGLDPAKDVKFAALPGPAIIPSYDNGAIDATFASGNLKFELLKRGAKVLVDMNDPKQHKAMLGADTYPHKVVMATADYIKANPEVVQHFINAMIRAMKWEEKQDSAKIADMVAPYLLGPQDEKIIADLRKPFSHDGIITPEGHKAIEQITIDVGLIKNPVPMDEVVDVTFVKKALENVK